MNSRTFEALTLEIFVYQLLNNDVYREYCKLSGKNEVNVTRYTDIPFLPIEFFKTHRIIPESYSAQKIFTSSGTSGQIPGKHHVHSLSLYERSFLSGFDLFFGNPENYCILALLPSYAERSGSSLVYMMQKLMKASRHPLNNFYLDNYSGLSDVLIKLNEMNQKTILIGVTFALIELAEKYPVSLDHIMIMETGGMKGKRAEITREEIHQILTRSFHALKIYSEYGMTELLSQAYSTGEGRFHTPPWMKVLIRGLNDPFQVEDQNASGAINIIDLANLDSCAFIATADLGKINNDGSFEVQGRMDQSDVRGCNLMLELS
ncbi:MAG: acyl transferase [Chitinophagales bacterium]